MWENTNEAKGDVMAWKVGKNWSMGKGKGRERKVSQETSYSEFLKGQF